MKRIIQIMFTIILVSTLSIGCPVNQVTNSITYDGNGSTSGSVPVDSTEYTEGTLITVLGNTGSLMKTGYSFDGWNTQSDGNGTSYLSDGTLTMGSSDVTLYAQWVEVLTYGVTYDGNGSTSGSVPVDSTEYTEGSLITVLGNTGSLTKPGFTFDGWNTVSSGIGTAFQADDTFNMISDDVTLYAQWLAEPGIRDVAAGQSFLLILKDDGTLWVKGVNTYGQLGTGDNITHNTAVQVMSGTSIKAISAGTDFSMILDTNGKLYASGNNGYGQFGNGTTVSSNIFTEVRTGVSTVDCGYTYTMVIDTDGKLYGSGQGTIDGALGTGSDYNKESFIEIDSNVTAVSAAYRHTLYLKSGTLYAMGNNGYGQLFKGVRSSTAEMDPIAVATGYTNIRSISAGFEHSLFVTTDDELYVVGSQTDGELGNGNASDDDIPSSATPYYNSVITKLADNVQAAEAGSNVTMILKNDNTLLGVGSDYNGQQGDGDNDHDKNLTLVQVMSGVHTFSVGEYHTAVWKIDGTVWDTYNRNADTPANRVNGHFDQITLSSDD